MWARNQSQFAKINFIPCFKIYFSWWAGNFAARRSACYDVRPSKNNSLSLITDVILNNFGQALFT